MSLKIAIAPEDVWSNERTSLLRQTIAATGSEITGIDDARALVWLDHKDGQGLKDVLDSHPAIRWVQLPWAGVEPFANAGLFQREMVFTCAKGAYGEQVGEHAVVLAHVCLRQLARQARADGWLEVEPRSLFGRRITILGAGGIAQTVISLLQPYGCEITVVRKRPDPVLGVVRTVSFEELHEVLPETQVLILALALTPESRHIIDEAELALLAPDAVLINVARGAHVEQDALVEALHSGRLSAAGLDVTDPEPLPSDHPLWGLDNVIITSHSADSDTFVTAQLAKRIEHNIACFSDGKPMQGLVDPENGY